MNKKETVLSVLKEIRDLLKAASVETIEKAIIPLATFLENMYKDWGYSNPPSFQGELVKDIDYEKENVGSRQSDKSELQKVCHCRLSLHEMAV